MLFFYPEAMTPGCTTEACDFRDSLGSLQAAGYRVLGISPDEPEKLGASASATACTYTCCATPTTRCSRPTASWGEKTNYGKIVKGSSARRS